MTRRRRRNKGLLEVLLYAPWWASLITGAIFFLGLAVVLPFLLSSSPITQPIGNIARSVSWIVLPFFSVLSLLAYIRAKRAAKMLQTAKSRKKSGTKVSNAASTARAAFTSKWGLAEKEHLDAHQHSSDSLHEVKMGDGVPVAEEEKRAAIPAWTLESLLSLEWKRFELLCARYYELAGFKSETLAKGADGGIDVKLYKIDMDTPIAIVQCKAWTRQVGVSEIRELLGVMAHEKVQRGIFVTTSTYTRDALAFADANPIQLLDGHTLLTKINSLDAQRQASLAAFAFEGDYRTPTCASCGIKMVERTSQTRGTFWGCQNYPKCKTKLNKSIA